MRINKRVIYGIDFILIVGTLLVMFFAVGYVQPLAIAPLNGFETTDNAVLFEFDKAETILIDDNLEFSSPEIIYAEDYLVINLKPGIYYWKLQRVTESEVRKFTILSEVDLRLEKGKSEGEYKVVNAGNVKLNVGVYDNNVLKENVVLDVGKAADASGIKFIGRQDE